VFQVNGHSRRTCIRDCCRTRDSRRRLRSVPAREHGAGRAASRIADSTFLTPAEFRRYIELASQRREIAFALFDVEAFVASAAVDEAAVAAHYESNKDSYKTAETVDLEYVELAVADIADKVAVTDDAVRALYEQERERFQTVEDRHARHILIAVQGNDEEAARAKAEGVAARVRNGADFAAVAKEASDDAGTKAQGGDLGWMSRGQGGRSRMRCSRSR